MQENASLKAYHTFGIDVQARYLIEAYSIDEVRAIYSHPAYKDIPKLILGGGSNVLFTENYPGIVILNKLRGIHVIDENDSAVELEVASGENWHNFVLFCVERGWGGIENLSLIPGTVGAAPMQNIGAYGVEIKEVLVSVTYLDLETLEVKTLNKEQCDFGYRESIFKHALKGKTFIVSVRFSLLKKGHVLKMNYGDIKMILAERQVNDPQIKDISEAVIAIRQSKLPDPAELGNAGSFFKNPEIPVEQFESLIAKNPLMPSYPMPSGMVKIPAGWLIEQSGWKGKRVGNTGSHARQALVLVNYGEAKAEEVRNLAYSIIDDVKEKFGIQLHPEVNFI